MPIVRFGNIMTQKIIDKITYKTGVPDLVELLTERLSFGELQSLLLKVFALKVRKKSVHDILREYQASRFTTPSDIDPVQFRKLESGIFSLLPSGFEIIDLSPLTPIGTSSVLTTVHQNNVVSTIRNLEAAADTTNVLALECALRRSELLKKDKASAELIRFCSSQRLTRAQPFENKDFSAHFSVLALCTAGRDTGNDSFESDSLEEHIGFYLNIFEKLMDLSGVKNILIRLFSYEGTDNANLIEVIRNKFSRKKLVSITTEENSSFGENYYTRLRFSINVINSSNEELNCADGGFTDWTARLLNNKKERLLTSGIGTDFLLRTLKLKI